MKAHKAGNLQIGPPTRLYLYLYQRLISYHFHPPFSNLPVFAVLFTSMPASQIAI